MNALAPGALDTVAAQVRELVETVPTDYRILSVAWCGLGHELSLTPFERFAHEAMPRFVDAQEDVLSGTTSR